MGNNPISGDKVNIDPGSDHNRVHLVSWEGDVYTKESDIDPSIRVILQYEGTCDVRVARRWPSPIWRAAEKILKTNEITLRQYNFIGSAY
jgi:hypothetical protein